MPQQRPPPHRVPPARPPEWPPEWPGQLRTAHVLLIAGLLFLSWLMGSVLLLVFAAIVLAVGLDGAASFAARHTPLSRGFALLVVCALILAFLTIVAMTVASQIIDQFQELWRSIVDIIEDWQERFMSSGWAGLLDNGEQLAGAANQIITRMGTFGLITIGALASIVVMIVLGVFLAYDPQLYRDGTIKLVPPRHRPLFQDTFSAVAYTLRWWFLAQLISMAILGVTVGLGLWVIGIELWLALALLTALLTFIPYLGPIIAGAPILLVGFADSAETGIIVTVFYLIVQNIEGNVIMPLIYQKAVRMAPALSIAMQVLLGLAFGIVGFILAAPLTVALMVMVQKMYVEAALGEKP